MDGSPVTLAVPECVIYSLSSEERANYWAKRYSQALANARVTCKARCYAIICTSFEQDPEVDPISPPHATVTNNGITGLIRTDANLYRFTVMATCDPESELHIDGYQEDGTKIDLAELTLVEGNSVTVSGADLESDSIVILDLVFDLTSHLIDAKNVAGARLLYPGVTCDYNKTNVVVGQALGCADLPCGIAYVPSP